MPSIRKTQKGGGSGEYFDRVVSETLENFSKTNPPVNWSDDYENAEGGVVFSDENYDDGDY